MNWNDAFKPWFGGRLTLRCKQCDQNVVEDFKLLRLLSILHAIHDFLGVHAAHPVFAKLEP